MPKIIETYIHHAGRLSHYHTANNHLDTPICRSTRYVLSFINNKDQLIFLPLLKYAAELNGEIDNITEIHNSKKIILHIPKEIILKYQIN